ncbi:DUF4349 domain-containing protein [Proteiniclasticum sp. C24MP]|uniref:DUF4349 domain-containing protein n=1 Tax=Proteiniclasticum sp. C24MP TaxID=3374101 RepID=UPI00375536E2
MKTGKKIFIGISSILLLSFIGVFIFTLLGGSLVKNAVEDSMGYAPGMPVESPAEVPSYDESGGDYEQGYGRDGSIGDKIIGTYSMNFETLEFQETITDLEALVSKYNGYIENSQIYNQSSSEGRVYKYARHTLRIPKEDVMAFNTELKLMAHMVQENSSVQNVTRYYRDTETRLDTLEAQRKRLNELYEQAERIEDIINIESKLNDIIYQIESLKGELQYLDEEINYSTVTTYVQEVSKLTTGESIQASFSERISNALSESVYFFQEAMISFFIVLIYLVPFLVIFGILAYAGNKIIRRRKPKVKSGSSGNSHIEESESGKQ